MNEKMFAGRRRWLVLAGSVLLISAATHAETAKGAADGGGTNQGGATVVPDEAQITNAIDRAMQYTRGKEAQGLPQYNDNIEDCGLYIVEVFPQERG